MKKSERQAELEETQARRRAELIIQVQAGRMSASAAAAQLGVSRKTYYKWEQRGLSAILGSLREGKPGRPPEPVDLISVCGPGDIGEPVITIMLPGED